MAPVGPVRSLVVPVGPVRSLVVPVGPVRSLVDTTCGVRGEKEKRYIKVLGEGSGIKSEQWTF